MTERWISPCGRMELRLGDYREVLTDVQCDAVITDPPYGKRTHEAQAFGTGKTAVGKITNRRAISYGCWSGSDVRELVSAFSPRTYGWIVCFTSHDLTRDYDDAFCAEGRYAFCPLPFFVPGMTVRLAGDGPSSWTTWLMVARPKSGPVVRWGTLPGGYVCGRANGIGRADEHIGGKPLGGMRAIVRDYSRPGDLVCDPCAGGGTTLLAAAMEGRRAIGAEIDPATYAKAVKRLSAGYTPQLF